MDGWTFSNAAGGGWEWRYLDPSGGGVSKASSRAFPSLLLCIRDAMLNGYDREAEPTARLTRPRETAFRETVP